jgi:hypothetical protein
MSISATIKPVTNKGFQLKTIGIENDSGRRAGCPSVLLATLPVLRGA